MKPSACSCDICEEAKDALRRLNRLQSSWQCQTKEKRRRDLKKQKEEEGVSGSEMNEFIKMLKENEHLLLCNECNGQCHPGTPYKTFAKSTAACRTALLCPKVHVPPLDLPVIDLNFRPVDGKTDEFKIEPEKCCYGNHVGLKRSVTGRVEEYMKCGWDGKFSDMPLHKWSQQGSATKEDVEYSINACPNEINRAGKVIWMTFQKVARVGKSDDDEAYGEDNGVKFQTEWLPVEGTVKEFFVHVRDCINRYLPHSYEVTLSKRVDKCAERAFIIDPAARDDCPDEFKDVVCEVVDFSSDISAKRAHDATCSFPETHKLEVHHLIFNSEFVTVDEIEKDHKRSATLLRKKAWNEYYVRKMLWYTALARQKRVQRRIILQPRTSSQL